MQLTAPFQKAGHVTPLALNQSSFQLPNKPRNLTCTFRAVHITEGSKAGFHSQAISGKLNISDCVKVGSMYILLEWVCLKQGYMCKKKLWIQIYLQI